MNTETWAAVAALIAAAIAGLAAAIAIFQAKQARRAADAAERQAHAAEAQMREATRQAEAAHRQAEASESQVALQQQQWDDIQASQILAIQRERSDQADRIRACVWSFANEWRTMHGKVVGGLLRGPKGALDEDKMTISYQVLMDSKLIQDNEPVAKAMKALWDYAVGEYIEALVNLESLNRAFWSSTRDRSKATAQAEEKRSAFTMLEAAVDIAIDDWLRE